MKKVLRIVLIIIGVVVGIILLDTIQALVFNNNPIIGIQTKCRSKEGLFKRTTGYTKIIQTTSFIYV